MPDLQIWRPGHNKILAPPISYQKKKLLFFYLFEINKFKKIKFLFFELYVKFDERKLKECINFIKISMDQVSNLIL